MAKVLESLTKIATTIRMKGDNLKDCVLEQKKLEEEKEENQRKEDLDEKRRREELNEKHGEKELELKKKQRKEE